MNTRLTRASLLIAIPALIVAACNAGTAPTPAAPSSAAAATSAPAATQEQASAPQVSADATDAQASAEGAGETSAGSAGASGGAGASFSLPNFNADPELAATLPDEINGTPLTKFSFAGADFVTGTDTEDAQRTQSILDRLGATAEDLSVAIATDTTGTLPGQLGAFRIRGANGEQALQEFIAAAEEESGTEGTVEEQNIGGRTVRVLTDPGDEEGPFYAYASGDTFYFVQSTDPAFAAQALAALP